MKAKTIFLKTKLFFYFFILFPATVFLYSGCDKDDDSNDPAPSCGDGIQNQGETGIDCGGPCAACATIMCNGNGENKFLPLTNANYWKYSDLDASNSHYSLTVNGTQAIGPNTYQVIEFCMFPPNCTVSSNYYLRTASNGDVYQYIDSMEYLLVPANPSVNQNWPFPVQTSIGSRKVMNINASVTTYDCSYTGCIEIREFNTSQQTWKIFYYKKGVGQVYEVAGTEIYRLVGITLH